MIYKMLAKSLQKWDIIGIIAPSKPFKTVKKVELDNFINYMKTQWIQVQLSKNFYARNKYGFAGWTPQERADDVNSIFSNNNIKAIWCLQWWEPANQTLDLIDFENIRKNPKIFIGKSDIDVLLLAINKKSNLITFHGCDSKIGSNKELDFDYTKKWFWKRFFEKSKIIEACEERICIHKWQCEGKIKGCNISSILRLAGTQYFPDFTNSILFIETYKSNPAKIIVQLTQLKQLWVFEKIKWLVIGNNFWFQSEEFKVENIIQEFLQNYNLPILKINEFGHYQPHAFLPIGAEIKLDADNKSIEILEDFLE